MNNDDLELVDKMWLTYMNYRSSHNGRSFNCQEAMIEVLSVVKANIWRIAKSCEKCGGRGKVYDYNFSPPPPKEAVCEVCRGAGVVAKGYTE